jgi:hypothetical protein
VFADREAEVGGKIRLGTGREDGRVVADQDKHRPRCGLHAPGLDQFLGNAPEGFAQAPTDQGGPPFRGRLQLDGTVRQGDSRLAFEMDDVSGCVILLADTIDAKPSNKWAARNSAGGG